MEKSLFSFALLLFVSSSFTLASSQPFSDSSTDQDALLAFQNAITSASVLTTNWSRNTSICDWIGVSCSIQIQRVTALNLSGFDLVGTVAPHLGNLSFLRSLDISSNNFTGSIPSEMSKLQRLNVIKVGFNNLSGEIPSGIFTNMSSLIEIDVRYNKLSGQLPSDICSAGNSNTPKIKRLLLAENQLDGEIPVGIYKCRELEELRFSNNQFSGNIPTEIGNLSMLTRLSRNQLMGSLPATLGKLKRMQRLYIHDNQLQGCIPTDLCQISQLAELNLSSNMLVGPIPECLGELTSLTIMFLDSNKLNSTLPSNFWNLINLVRLNLSSNYLSGQLSSQIGNLVTIGILDLSSNQFSGEIPSSIDGCLSLVYLYLSNNNFNGPIPQVLGKLVGLEFLNLSNNNLSGLIPEALQDLVLLQYFDVSHNRLQGQIPNGGPFVNFTAQSFVDNHALCGATRFQVPPCPKNKGWSRLKKRVSLLLKYVLPSLMASAIMLVILILILTRRRVKKNMPPHLEISPGTFWRNISYVELVRDTGDFSETNLLGRGSFGSVFKGMISDGLTIAVKVFHLELEGAMKSFDTECEILSSIRHKNLLRIVGCCSNDEFKAIILAYMPNGSLEKWLHSADFFLDILQRLKIALDVALALEHLHHRHTFPVVHCDIKPSNVLLDEDMIACVGDFGISKLFDEGELITQTQTIATIGYASPEYGSEGIVSTNGDVYSYGIMLLEIFTSKSQRMICLTRRWA